MIGQTAAGILSGATLLICCAASIVRICCTGNWGPITPHPHNQAIDSDSAIFSASSDGERTPIPDQDSDDIDRVITEEPSANLSNISNQEARTNIRASERTPLLFSH